MVKRTTLLFSLLLLATASAREKWPVFIAFPEADLQRDERAALQAMNSPAAWSRFPKHAHERHYTPILREISFAFSTSKDRGTVTVIIPTTRIGPRHRALIYVTFDGLGRIRDLDEVPEI